MAAFKFSNRLQSVQEQIQKEALDALFITNQSNVFYLSGIPPLPDAKELAALVTVSELFVFTYSTYKDAAERSIQQGLLHELSSSTNLIKHLKSLRASHNLKTIGFEANDLTVSQLNNFKKEIPTMTWKGSERIVEMAREIKDEGEITSMVKAAKITDQAFDFILQKIKPGVTEKALALDLEVFLKTKADGIAFSPIVASGINSASPHHISGNKKIKHGEMVLLDFGAKIDGYCADLTRTVSVGKASQKFTDIYQTVLEAQQQALHFLLNRKVTEIPAKEVDAIARNFIMSKGYPSIPHGLGHCLGINIHELPRLAPTSTEILKPGMVFTIEPGIYIPGWGGVRIENVVVWKEGGMSILSQSSKNLIEL